MILALYQKYQANLVQAIKLSIPVIIGQVGIMLMSVADNVMVSNFGTTELSAASAANNIFFAISGLTFGILYAVGTLVSIKSGERNHKEGFKIYRAGVWIGLLLFVLQFIVLLAIAYNFDILDQSTEVNVLAPDYLKIISISTLPMLVTLACRQFTDGLGHVMIAAAITIGGLLLNIFLNWILIYGNWGAPALGLNGAGYATLLARIAMMLAALYVNHKHSLMQPYRINERMSWSETLNYAKDILRIGIPIGLQTAAEWTCFSISGLFVGKTGSVPQAAHAVALSVAAFTFMFVSGIAMAGSILAGNAYGEKNQKKLRNVANTIFFLIVVVEIITSLFFIFGADLIGKLHDTTAEVQDIIGPLFLLAALFQIADGLQVGSMNLLRSIKDVNFATLISIFSYWVVSLPLSWIFCFEFHMGVYGVWIGFTVGLFVAAIFGVTRYYKQLNKLKWG